MKQLIIHPSDNVAVEISSGHKVALRDIKAGENVIKYSNGTYFISFMCAEATFYFQA